MYPQDLRYIEIKAIVVTADTTILAKTYQPKSVLNQWGSIDIIQSQDIIDSVTKKNTRKTAESLKFLM
jgi:hypothetical protein